MKKRLNKTKCLKQIYPLTLETLWGVDYLYSSKRKKCPKTIGISSDGSSFYENVYFERI